MSRIKLYGHLAMLAANLFAAAICTLAVFVNFDKNIWVTIATGVLAILNIIAFIGHFVDLIRIRS